jgi:hypothetical protein
MASKRTSRRQEVIYIDNDDDDEEDSSSEYEEPSQEPSPYKQLLKAFGYTRAGAGAGAARLPNVESAAQATLPDDDDNRKPASVATTRGKQLEDASPAKAVSSSRITRQVVTPPGIGRRRRQNLSRTRQLPSKVMTPPAASSTRKRKQSKTGAPQAQAAVSSRENRKYVKLKSQSGPSASDSQDAGGAMNMNMNSDDDNETMNSRDESDGPESIDSDVFHIHYGTGPFPPLKEESGLPSYITQCRKCKWLNKFEHKNFLFDRLVASGRRVGLRKKARWYYLQSTCDEIHPTGYLDWCHACGRVASERDFRKVQSQPYVPSPCSIYLGTREIDFRLKAHDPREMDQFRKKWEEQKWTHDETEMEQELFEHRLGKFPLLEMIVASMPITTNDKIPKDGRSINSLAGRKAMASLSETEAVLIDEHVKGLILKELCKACPQFGMARSNDSTNTQYIDGDITGAWDRNTRKGVSIFLV